MEKTAAAASTELATPVRIEVIDIPFSLESVFCVVLRTVRSSASAAVVRRCGGPTPRWASVGTTVRSRLWDNLG